MELGRSWTLGTLMSPGRSRFTGPQHPRHRLAGLSALVNRPGVSHLMVIAFSQVSPPATPIEYLAIA
jgi:hypothetical protein